MDWLVLSLLLLGCAGTPGLGATVDELHAHLTKLHKTLDALMRQAMLQQLFLETKTRGDGDSGVDQVKHQDSGTRPYHANTHYVKHSAPGPVYGISVHSHLIFTDGFDAVLNGNKFRKSAQYIWFKKPHPHSKRLGATTYVEKAKVPPAVLQKKTVAEQSAEMAEWFKAFKANDYKTRDFRPYFRPLLCYLEGYWDRMTPPKGKYFDDRFKREIEQYRFETVMGRRQGFYTFRGYNPSTIFDFSGNEPIFAKFKSRTLCAPLRTYILPNRFRVFDELSSRAPSFRTYIDLIMYGNARFSINPLDRHYWTDRMYYRVGLLDKLMSEIPGLDNYPGSLTDNAFDELVYPNPMGPKALNTAYYHRYYSVKRKGAMGQLNRHRSFSDSTVFMAQNSQPNMPAMPLEDCKWVNRKRVCKTYTQRWSYAIPLAVVYQTPLQSWNPYNVLQRNIGDTSATANGRNGGFTVERAYNGSSPHNCATLPPDFVPHRVYGVLDKTGKVIKATGCGIKQVINLKRVGNVRQLYPIFPTHVEGSTENKEVEALKDIVMESKKYLNLIRNP